MRSAEDGLVSARISADPGLAQRLLAGTPLLPPG
jgi:hypothetical protein